MFYNILVRMQKVTIVVIALEKIVVIFYRIEKNVNFHKNNFLKKGIII